MYRHITGIIAGTLGAENLAKYRFVARKRHEIRPSHASPLTKCPSQDPAKFQAVPGRPRPSQAVSNTAVRKNTVYSNNGIYTDGIVEF